ncbi:MAG: aldehyde dehydrogenase family protein, partial [Microbacterium sp.]
MTSATGIYIDGTWHDVAEHRENINPSDHSDVIGLFGRAERSAVDDAVDAASRAFPAWWRTSPQRRADLLE